MDSTLPEAAEEDLHQIVVETREVVLITSLEVLLWDADGETLPGDRSPD